MKNGTMSGNKLVIPFITDNVKFSDAATKTLVHIYPGVVVKKTEIDGIASVDSPSIVLIDTESVGGSLLERLLEGMGERLVIIVAKNFPDVRNYSNYLSGRCTVIMQADLSSMGLIQAVHHLLERGQLHEQLQKTSKHLRELSIRDDLTKLYNHHHMDELLSSEVKKANRYKRPLGLVIISIKNFTAINEALGHAEADKILAKASDIIRELVREVDIPARYGDNEFAVILPESDETAATTVASRIQEAMGNITLRAENSDFRIMTSCGIAALSDNIRTKENLIHTALGALIEAKRNGKTNICTSCDITVAKKEVKENRQLVEQLGHKFVQMAKEAERAYFNSIMKTISDMGFTRKVLMPHSERVAFFAQRLAESLGFGESATRSIHYAGLLHDTGKLAIDPELLNKASRLTGPEEELIRRHPLLAVDIIGHTPFFANELDIILHHHERFDGQGYPNRVQGDKIPIAARVLSIAEAWDTMITSQPYRPEPLALDQALAELKAGAGSQFDPDLVDRFINLVAGS